MGSTRGPTVAFESSTVRRRAYSTGWSSRSPTKPVTRQDGHRVAHGDRLNTACAATVATQTQNKRSTIAWVWDVYDAEQRRTLRISGEEPASAAGTGTWAAADDQVLRRVASAGMDRLVAYLAAPSTETRPTRPRPAPAATPATTIAAGNEDSMLPEAGALASADPVPTPRRRPSTAGDRDLAYLDTNH